MYLLQFRDQSEKDLTRKLKEREYTEKEIEEAMERLRDCEYVNDENLADELFEATAAARSTETLHPSEAEAERACYGEAPAA